MEAAAIAEDKKRKIVKIPQGDRIEIPLKRSTVKKLLGPNDSFLRLLEAKFNTSVIVRETSFLIDPEVKGLDEAIEELVSLSRAKSHFEIRDIQTVVRMHGPVPKVINDYEADIILDSPSVVIKTRTLNQGEYFRALRESELVFAIGPAGTGKTFLAVAWAVSLFERGAVEKIVLVKPVVEAGEKLGFLPGDIKEKVDPYFKPLYDALLFMMPAEKVKRLIEQSIIEIAPLAYMRGRSLNRSITILDEAQNTKPMQMKMFLTRLGPNSRAVVTGDLTQIDLEGDNESGLANIKSILEGIEGIEFVFLDSTDVVRHRLVSDIIKAYDKYKNGANN